MTTTSNTPFERFYKSEPADIEPVLGTIREMEAFQEKGNSPLDTLMQNELVKRSLAGFREWMNNLLENIHDFLARYTPSEMSELSEHVITAASYVIGVLVVFLAVVVLYGILSWLRRRIGSARGSFATSSLQPQPPALRDALFHRNAAYALAEQDDYAGAIRQLYLSLLCHLDEKNLVPFEDARTNLEYLDKLDLHTPAELSSHFRQMAVLFEPIRYGGHEAELSGFEQAKGILDRLETLICRVAERGKVNAI
jgi:hypothetical protein